LAYCIDTNAIITPWRTMFPPDIFSSPWKKIEELIDQNEIIATREVLNELESIDDDIFNWIKNFKDTMFVDLNEDEQHFVTQIHTDHPNLVDPNKTNPDADPFIISISKFRNLTVITMENPRSPFNIPQVCNFYNVNCVDILDFFRELGITF